jgi:hypothetical protein
VGCVLDGVPSILEHPFVTFRAHTTNAIVKTVIEDFPVPPVRPTKTRVALRAIERRELEIMLVKRGCITRDDGTVQSVERRCINPGRETAGETGTNDLGVILRAEQLNHTRRFSAPRATEVMLCDWY